MKYSILPITRKRVIVSSSNFYEKVPVKENSETFYFYLFILFVIYLKLTNLQNHCTNNTIKK